jgi:hypothetical protein
MLLSRLKENVLEAKGAFCDCMWKEGMPESWCCRGMRCCSMLGWVLEIALDEGRESRKPCIEPRRRGAEVAEENEDSRRRVFWRVKLPVTAPNARERELVCEWCETPSTAMADSLTASRAMPASRTSCWWVLNVCEAVRFIVCGARAAEAGLVSSSAAEEVFGRYDRMEGLRCMGGAGEEKEGVSGWWWWWQRWRSLWWYLVMGEQSKRNGGNPRSVCMKQLQEAIRERAQQSGLLQREWQT